MNLFRQEVKSYFEMIGGYEGVAYLGIEDLATLLNIPESTARTLCKEKCNYVKIGRAYKVSKENFYRLKKDIEDNMTYVK